MLDAKRIGELFRGGIVEPSKEKGPAHMIKPADQAKIINTAKFLMGVAENPPQEGSSIVSVFNRPPKPILPLPEDRKEMAYGQSYLTPEGDTVVSAETAGGIAETAQNLIKARDAAEVARAAGAVSPIVE